MKKIMALLLLAILLLALASCGVSNTKPASDETTKIDIIIGGSDSQSDTTSTEGTFGDAESSSTEKPSDTIAPAKEAEDDGLQIDVAIGKTVLTATLENNSSTDAFVELLKQDDITVELHDYGNFEKTGSLPQSLERNDEQITTEPGDIILYQGNQISVFYDANTYSLTRLGKINDVTQGKLKDLLGDGNVTATFRLRRKAEEPAKISSVLVAYFSATGTTKTVAGYVKEVFGADICEIVPAVPYTSEDLNYSNSNSRTSKEKSDGTSRPAISGSVTNMDDYDVIFIGYPIWHGQAPKIISTFLESYDFSGKTIIPFCTSHSSGIGSSDTNLHSLASKASWFDGKRFSANTSKEEVASWVDAIGIPKTTTTAVGKFDFDTQTVLLNSGYTMPLNGLGTYSLSDEECYNSVTDLLENGGRLIDTAYMYHNEAAVGRAVRESSVPREKIFVTTKLYPNQFADAAGAIDDALERMGIDYIDLMLLHHPGTGDVEAYKAMEQAVADGKIRSIGLSNWYVEELKEFLPQVSITPAVVQNEIHPYYQENDVIPYIQNLGIVVEGWYPFGGRGHTGEMLGNETISAIANAHGVTSAQVILRWNLQKGVVVIPGSSSPDHIQENTELYDFELTVDDMTRINALDRNEKHDWY